uniref:uncharacterized protein LOC122583171 n=1 Tax=Erigeron canadensis TaxID=72917 RepID=UPI001CB97BAA|nr:uncharacterized protein LOC122583171 [Erigeron canadensis]
MIDLGIGTGSNSVIGYANILNQLASYSSVPKDLISSLSKYYLSIYRSEQQNKYNKPMLWIGIYIAVASLMCMLTMVADLVCGWRSRKLWFPCKYFTLNAASLSIIAISMKLPMDLGNSMPGDVDQAAKLGSMAFMCTMMVNLLPSLATMNTRELITNIIALDVLVITLVVNVCIQIKTGVVSYSEIEHLVSGPNFHPRVHYNKLIASIYVAILLVLIIIQTSSTLMILKSKQILELKYREGHETTLKDLEVQQPGGLVVDQLKQHVSNHYIMAETGSPQFMTAWSVTTSASGVICALSALLDVFVMIFIIPDLSNYGSDYRWSISVILITQFCGVILGTIAPLSRCFTSINFKLSIKWIWNHISVFKVEAYWTHKLSEWKDSSIPFSFRSRKFKIVAQNLIILTMNICMVFQKTVVVVCKIIALIPIFFVICILYFVRCYKRLKGMFNTAPIVPVRKPEQQEQNKDPYQYILQLEEDMELSERTLNGITKSVNRLFQKAEKQQPKNLLKFLEESYRFEGVGNFDIDRVSTTLTASEIYLDCWSLPVVTLATIAISLPNIQCNLVDRLLSSVSEGLVYVTIVEENLNANVNYASVQKPASKTLWVEIEVYQTWLGNKLQDHAPHRSTSLQILQWFKDTAKNIVDAESTDVGVRDDKSICMAICASSMYNITQTIQLSYGESIEHVSQEELFAQLSSMIANILATCLKNLPQVIEMKCHTSSLEKREASVHAAAQLLGETTQIINCLRDRKLPTLELFLTF